jgi:hypothetical protein
MVGLVHAVTVRRNAATLCPGAYKYASPILTYQTRAKSRGYDLASGTVALGLGHLVENDVQSQSRAQLSPDRRRWL